MSKAAGYGELVAELENVMTQLQDEATDVEAATRLYEKGLALTVQLEAKLQTAENKITELKANFDK